MYLYCGGAGTVYGGGGKRRRGCGWIERWSKWKWCKVVLGIGMEVSTKPFLVEFLGINNLEEDYVMIRGIPVYLLLLCIL